MRGAIKTASELRELGEAILRNDPELADPSIVPLPEETLELACALAEQAGTELAGPRQESWLERLDVVSPSLERTIGFCFRSGREELGARISIGLWRYWRIRGRLEVGHGFVARALQTPLSARLRMRALEADAYLLHEQGAIAEPAQEAEQLRVVASAVGDGSAVALALNLLGVSLTSAATSYERKDCSTERWPQPNEPATRTRSAGRPTTRPFQLSLPAISSWPLRGQRTQRRWAARRAIPRERRSASGHSPRPCSAPGPRPTTAMPKRPPGSREWGRAFRHRLGIARLPATNRYRRDETRAATEARLGRQRFAEAFESGADADSAEATEYGRSTAVAVL